MPHAAPAAYRLPQGQRPTTPSCRLKEGRYCDDYEQVYRVAFAVARCPLAAVKEKTIAARRARRRWRRDANRRPTPKLGALAQIALPPCQVLSGEDTMAVESASHHKRLYGASVRSVRHA